MSALNIGKSFDSVLDRWDRARNSLRFRLTIRVVVPMLICFGVGNVVLYAIAKERLISGQQAMEQRRALILDRYFSAWEKDVREMLRSLSLSPDIRSMTPARAQSVLSPVYPLAPLRNWRLWKADGSLISHTGTVTNIPLQQIRIRQDLGFQGALQGRFNFQISAIQLGSRLDACLQANQPIYSLTNPAVVDGVLSFCLPLSKLGEDSGLLLLGGEGELGQSGIPVGWIEAHKGKYAGRSFFLLNRHGNLVFPVNSGSRFSHLSLLTPKNVMASPWAPFVDLARKAPPYSGFRRVVVQGVTFYILTLPVSPEWLSVTLIDQDTILAPVRRNLRGLVLAQAITLLVTSMAIALACGRVSRPIKNAGIAIKLISDGNFDVHLPERYPGELGELYTSINETGGRLKELLNQALAHAVTDQQLETAKSIQRSFIVQALPRLDGIEVSAFFDPAYEIGADWYDALADGDSVYLAVADVCDKGVASALFMSVFRTLVRYGLGNMVEQQHSEQSLAKVVSLVNDYMVANHGDTLMFATMFIARFCPSSGRLSYVSAGHEAPLLRRGSQCQRLDAPGPAMGLFPGAVYELGHVQLEPGDALVVFSDGIIDARSPADESFTLDRLEDLLLTMAEHLTADQIADEIRSRVKAHMNGASQFDDMTLMVMRVVPT